MHSPFTIHSDLPNNLPSVIPNLVVMEKWKKQNASETELILSLKRSAFLFPLRSVHGI